MKTMNTKLMKGLAGLGIGAMVLGLAAVSPALADGRHDDNCGRQDVTITYTRGDRDPGHDNDRRDRDDHRGDNGRFSQRGDRR